MVKVAMLSKWHVHASDYASQLIKTGKVEIAAVWDEIEERGKTWAGELNAEFIGNMDALLSREDIQAVICGAPTTMHREVLTAAAHAGKHIFTEKVLAVNTAEAEEIAAAVKKSGVLFVISYPLRRDPLMCYAKSLCDKGFFGKIGMVRMRRSHSGITDGWLPDYWFDTSKSGGGAMMDLGAHPMYMLPWLCGTPKRIAGVFNNLYGTSSDENAVVTIEFENGAIGVGETSFISHNTPDLLEIYGSDATLLVWGQDIKMSIKKLKRVYEGYFRPDTEKTITMQPDPITAFIDAVLEHKAPPSDLDIDSGVLVSRLMEAAYRSNRTGAIVPWGT
ncbi:MAG: Gfo/Idh/MocA family oxidoreductase [Treponema sp.]|nr:Gfo/Idh/MocA family oxidoreductase [Treponema sp.]